MSTPLAKSAAPTRAADRKLTLREVVDGLVDDKLIGKEDAAALREDPRYKHGDIHPLVAVADAKLKSLKPPQRMLDIETLTQWLAARVNMPYYHTDPLKIDLRAVTEVMSSDYAQRRSILPVEFDGKDAVIATAEPYAVSYT